MANQDEAVAVRGWAAIKVRSHQGSHLSAEKNERKEVNLERNVYKEEGEMSHNQLILNNK